MKPSSSSKLSATSSDDTCHPEFAGHGQLVKRPILNRKDRKGRQAHAKIFQICRPYKWFTLRSSRSWRFKWVGGGRFEFNQIPHGISNFIE
jgi:hypothetical protein